ncbi:MAG TPA: hypothetical protein PK689_05420 [Kiritimatiellia bacterium]|mgnify:FL=1|jgi:hypothetical protein|nr:hypothetical protein [Kiritimatiellia bacterium]
MIPLLLRVKLWLIIRAHEAHIDGCTECLACVADPWLRQRIEISRTRARQARRQAIDAYAALLPPHKRPSWRLA